MQLTEHFFHNSCLSKHNQGGFSKDVSSEIEDIGN